MTPTDAVTYAAVTLILTAVALLAAAGAGPPRDADRRIAGTEALDADGRGMLVQVRRGGTRTDADQLTFQDLAAAVRKIGDDCSPIG